MLFHPITAFGCLQGFQTVNRLPWAWVQHRDLQSGSWYNKKTSIRRPLWSRNTFELFIFCLFLLFVAGSYPVRFCPPEEQARNRFQSELEFVQCLANPNYLNFLAQRGYLRDRPFINYLKYLLYWKEPEYAKFLKYPHCLHMLELLQYEHFRKELVNAQCAKFIDEQQLLHWQHYSRKRTRLQQTLAEQQQPPQQPPPPHGNAATK
ncbi:Mediator of RNA polymerase II transcription subunit 31 [Xenotaenia resolanae]|uniref:Mediator of RNA polymerase II transcription subunit 31 n=1 Tax=Xenotaenia resolanae TaxID=208358 RepID=A0ABV0VTW6_9TELE